MNEDGGILVSAAAGSGKTSVLTARILRLVEDGADIRRMLICTFTRAAAREMRTRIAGAMERRAEETAEPRLRAQAELVVGADVCTIHKFAIKVVREQFAALGLPQGIRVGADEETKVLRDRAYKNAAAQLTAAGDEAFAALSRKYGGRDGKRLRELALELYDFMMSRPEGTLWLRRASETDPELYRSLLLERTAGELRELCRLLSRAPDMSELEEKPKQTAQDEEELAEARLLLRLFEAGMLEEYERRLPELKIKKVKPGMSESFKALKAEARSLLKSLEAQSPSELLPAIEDEVEYMRQEALAFAGLIDVFQEEFTALKLEKKLMSHDDCLRYAYDALSDEETSARWRSRYDYVFVDEYQDTNPLQDALLAKVAREDGLFMVGDMKQSIYRFRLADPLIFREKSRRLSKSNGLISMNHNFRSGRGVIDAVNGTMAALMSPTLGELEYTDTERMTATREGGRAELLLTSCADDEDSSGSAETEAKAVANRVLRLLAEETVPEGDERRPVTYGDICILVRSRSAYGEFERAFRTAGIPLKTDNDATAEPPEIGVFVSFLILTDTARSDIALLSALRWCGFDERDMAAIRAAAERESCPAFFDALMACAEGTSDLSLRIRDFLAMLSRFKLYARTLPVADAVMKIKTELDFDARLAALPPASRGRAFLRFIDQCAEAPAHARESMFAFVSYLEDVRRVTGSYLAGAEEDEAEGCVRMMTVHKSKGLEFPIVIFARTATAINTADKRPALLKHSVYGLAADILDPDTCIRRKTAVRSLLTYVLEREYKSEELRILYVAMTRARERLIISGAVKDTEKALAAAEIPLGEQGLLKKNALLTWVLYAKCCCGAPMSVTYGDTELRPRRKGGAEKPSAELVRQAVELAAASGEAAPDRCWDEQRIPSKVSVSDLKPDFQPAYGDADGETALRPKGRLTGAALGTAIHDVLMRLDLNLRSEQEVLTAIDGFVERLLMTEEEARAARDNASMLTRFLSGETAARIRAAEQVWRELPFCLGVTAAELELGDSEDIVVVQGRIDLVFQENGALVIVDYKTDRDGGSTASIARYQHQLSMYERALKSITELPVREKLLVFLRTGREVSVI